MHQMAGGKGFSILLLYRNKLSAVVILSLILCFSERVSMATTEALSISAAATATITTTNKQDNVEQVAVPKPTIQYDIDNDRDRVHQSNKNNNKPSSSARVTVTRAPNQHPKSTATTMKTGTAVVLLTATKARVALNSNDSMGEMSPTPQALIDRQQPAEVSLSRQQRPLHSAVNSANQSAALHLPVNDLQVDEKHFLNEIVKNFNKSIATNAGVVGHRISATALNEASPPPTLVNDIAEIKSSGTVPSILTLHSPRAPSKIGVGSNGIPSGSPAKQSIAKTHFHKSDSALLNYLFDSHVKHRHSDLRFGPHFVQVEGIELLNSSAILGGVGLMSCKISQLQDKTVSWVRRLVDNGEMLLLTVGMDTYSSDFRFRVDFQYPDDWRLRIDNVTKEDEGTYECMISTHPPQAIQTNFYVSSPEVLIVDEHGLPLYEKYYNLDSMLELRCTVNHITMTASVVHWHHDNVSLNYDGTRGGISVGTNLTEDAANSTLWVARVKATDSGNYTCSVGPHLHFTTSVHVLNESLAELSHGLGLRNSPLDGLLLMIVCMLLQFCYLEVLLASRSWRGGVQGTAAKWTHIR